MLSDWVEPAAERSCGQSFQYPYQVELNRKWEEKENIDKCMVLLMKQLENVDYVNLNTKNSKPLHSFYMQCRR